MATNHLTSYRNVGKSFRPEQRQKFAKIYSAFEWLGTGEMRLDRASSSEALGLGSRFEHRSISRNTTTSLPRFHKAQFYSRHNFDLGNSTGRSMLG